jgi:hypothetical protein
MTMKIPKRIKISLFLVALLIGLSSALGQSSAVQPAWPEITRESKPWTRWWWMGSAVNQKDLTVSMEAYQKAGLGGLEITPIYGVAGTESQFIPFLSPPWVAMLDHTLKEAKRLDLGVDMATGTGWPFGGPWVDADDACKNVAYKTYQLTGGQRLDAPVRFTQEPLVRAVGNQIYQLTGGILGVEGERPTDPSLRRSSRQIDIKELVEPISANKDLQALALDQVKFEKQLPLQVVMAYSDGGEILNLTDRVDANGKLDWVASPGKWTLYAVFQGWHGKMVERAAPGGEGNVIDHFSATPIRNYLRQFDRAFAGHDLGGLRAFFNDSYEVDDARGQSDWTPGLFEEFQKRRGYDLRHHLPALFGKDSEDKNARVLCDYRETVSDLLLDTFTIEWRKWAQSRGALVRNQAHGSPANILDLYAASDIPETEGTDLLRIKFASSAAHVTGKKLTSSESATWLNEHFRSSLADVKKALERYFLGGVNHIVYHGTNHSPQSETWPGWLFYAAVHFNPQNSWWTDFAALNQYVARVQSFLQQGKPDNDVLLYYPIYDRFSERGNALLEHFTGGGPEFNRSVVGAIANTLQRRGDAFDFISDRQLQNVTVAGRVLQTGGVSYQTVVVPECRFIPLATFEKLMSLARNGATVIVFKNLPGDVPGLARLEARRNRFRQLVNQLQFADSATTGVKEARLGRGAVLLGDDLEPLLARAGVKREAMVDQGLQFVRRSRGAAGRYYFIANWGESQMDGWVPLQVKAASAAIFDPMHGRSGFARLRASGAGGVEVYLQLAPGQSCIVETFDAVVRGILYAYFKPAGPPHEITGAWTVKFVAGGPELPPDATITSLSSWTGWGGDAVKKFSGTATYTITFPKPAGDADGWLLDLGRVCESARVRLNGRDLGTLIGPTFRLRVDKSLIGESNVLEVAVSNLMANRIADLDRRRVLWKKFYNVNFPSRLAQNRGEDGLFTAAKWEPLDSGLIGPVTLTPVASLRF